MPVETIKLTATFKVDGQIPESPFSTYNEILNNLIDYASMKNITSFKRLRMERYHELRMKYQNIPSHYIHTACQMACSIYKSFRKLKRRGLVRAEKPALRSRQ